MIQRKRWALGLISLPLLLSPVFAEPLHREQRVLPLPGHLDAVPMVNDNNPELIEQDGILLSTFSGTSQDSSIDVTLNGRFDLFSHHVYAGNDDSLESTLWLALLMAPQGNTPVTLTLIGGSTALSQATERGQTAAPFLPLPARMHETTAIVASGPGSRVAGDLLNRRTAAELTSRTWILEPGEPSLVLQLPIPVKGLDPLLNGRNLQLRLHSSGPVELATLAAHGQGQTPPSLESWTDLLARGELSRKEHRPTPRGSRGAITYSRVSGVQIGSRWQARLRDPAQDALSVGEQPVSWPISSLERGSLGTGQIQTGELQAFYPGTAWAAHGNYGVEYDLTLPLLNTGADQQRLVISLDSPLKTDRPSRGLRFHSNATGPVMFRGPVEVSGLNDQNGRALGRQIIHLVLRRGQQGPPLGEVSLQPGEQKDVRIRLVYPADATPPQVITVQPVKDSCTREEICP